jgi:hypothetical protein
VGHNVQHAVLDVRVVVEWRRPGELAVTVAVGSDFARPAIRVETSRPVFIQNRAAMMSAWCVLRHA